MHEKRRYNLKRSLYFTVAYEQNINFGINIFKKGRRNLHLFISLNGRVIAHLTLEILTHRLRNLENKKIQSKG